MHNKILLVFLLFFSSVGWSNNIFVADRLYTEKKYEEAKVIYLQAAEVGNPHAYYQLATMYYKGLGGEQDLINALLYFGLAAEQNFHNSPALLNSIIKALPSENQQAVMDALDTHKQNYGKQIKAAKYFPQINEQTITNKITFDGEETLKTAYQPRDEAWEDFTEFGGASFNNADDADFEENNFGFIITQAKVPYLIIDHDVYSDGSIRYQSEVQKFGFYKPLLDDFTRFPIAQPALNNTPVEFATRTYLGAAAYNKFTFQSENERLYGQIINQYKQFKNKNTIKDEFNLAMLMLNFPWLTQDENEAEKILLSLAKKGHSPAMYEYGFLLYREQREIEQAIFWLAEASKYGLIRAEYRLAKILESSPWVIHDEAKALYWYQSAMSKGDKDATIRAADILLTAKDESLQNLSLAKEYLSSLSASQSNNPEYIYLTALTHRRGEQRDIKLTIETLKRAILKAQIANWDTSEWEDLLNTITAGTVYVEDQN